MDVINIDVDLVRELKRQGKFYEASRLIRAHQESLKKNKDQDKKEIDSLYGKISYHKRKVNGICGTCGVRPARENKTKCESCNEAASKYNKYYRDKNECE